MQYSAIADNVAMSAEAARQCIEEVKLHQTHIRMLLLTLETQKGWHALGYSSMRECMLAEFGQSRSQLYRELKAAKIESVVSPRGDIGTIPEKHLRSLSKLPTEQWSSAWNEVVETAPPKGVTTKHVVSVVENLLKPTLQLDSPVATETEPDFYVGDWVEVRRPGAWYEKQGEVVSVEQYEIAVLLNQKKSKILRFYREELVKVLPLKRSSSESFYKQGDLLLIDCPKNVDCDYKHYNGCWAIVVSVGELGGIEVLLGGKTMRVKSSDTDPMDAADAQLREVAQKVNSLLCRDDIDEFDRNFLQQYLKRQTFTEAQIRHLDYFSDYYAKR